MNAKRKISGKDFVRDMRSGKSDSQLMENYSLSPTGLQKVFLKLVDSGRLRVEELYGRTTLRDDSVTIDLNDLGFSPDDGLLCIVPISDTNHPECRGAVCEIGENGLEVSGITAVVGETRSFLIDPRDFFAVDEFRFKAKCVWCKESPTEQSAVAGFEITGILFEDLENLRELVRRIKIEGQSALA
jgi:hypothetical protein